MLSNGQSYWKRTEIQTGYFDEPAPELDIDGEAAGKKSIRRVFGKKRTRDPIHSFQEMDCRWGGLTGGMG
jgi:hypothetical protein